MKPVIIIPSRLGSQRLSGKPLVDIAGEPMIVQVWRRACEADCGRVVVAAGDPEIVAAIQTAGGEAILTPADLPSGTDRVYAAFSALDGHEAYDRVVNLQGDLPTLAPHILRILLAASMEGYDIMTPAAPILDMAECDNPNVVKPVVSFSDSSADDSVGTALYFTRARVPFDAPMYYHHIGVYVYRPEVLARFVGLAPSPLEKCERLEQLRALEDGMRIGVVIVDTIPIGVDTETDLARARSAMAVTSSGRTDAT